MSYRNGPVWEDDREIPKNIKLDRSNCQFLGSLKEIQKE